MNRGWAFLAVVIVASVLGTSLSSWSAPVPRDPAVPSLVVGAMTAATTSGSRFPGNGPVAASVRIAPIAPAHVLCRGAPCRGIAGSDAFPGVGLPEFQESTSSPRTPIATDLGSLAWDVADDEAVFFGGWDGSAAENQTWVFQSGTWTNVTNPLDSPPARYGAAMAYDAQVGVDAVVLVGGCSPRTACPIDDTWTFFSGSWHNVTSRVGPAPNVSNATMTSWGPNGTVLYGGCTDRACSSESNVTWEFQNSSTCQLAYSGPCWTRATVHGITPPGLAGASIATDPLVGPENGTLALYGGFHVPCPDCRPVDSNATWLYNGGTWENVTSSFSGSAYPAVGRSFASLFWDPDTAELYLYGGEDVTTGALFDQVWTTNLYTWSVNASSPTSTVPALFAPAVTPGYDRSGGSVPPMLVGGLESPTTYEGRTWVFESALNTSLATLPSLESGSLDVEANVTVHFFSNTSGEHPLTASWSTGDGGEFAGGNGTHVYRTPGRFQANLTAVDLYGVREVSVVPVNVTLFTLTSLGSVSADQSVPIAWSVTALGGTPPYNFTWSFSDGTISYGSPLTHSFPSIGPVTVQLMVRDAVGTQVGEVGQVDVHPDLAATASARPYELDVDTESELSVVAYNGSPPYNVTWTLPGEITSRGATISYRPTMSGDQMVSVVVSDSVGGRWSTVLTLTVNSALTFTASSSAVSTTSGRTVTFDTHVQGGTSPYSYSWRFGDGGTSSAVTPTHTYATSGTFTVAVWVNDSGGGSFRQTVEVKIPRTSGGLLWQLAQLPPLELVAVVAGVVAVGLALALAIARWKRQGPAQPPRSPDRPRSPDPETSPPP